MTLTKIIVPPYTANRGPDSALWHVVEAESDTPVATVLARMWEDIEDVCSLVITLPSPLPRATITLTLGSPQEYAIERLLHNWLQYLLDDIRLKLETVARELEYSKESIVECRDDNPRVHCVNLAELLSEVEKTDAEEDDSRIRRLVASNRS